MDHGNFKRSRIFGLRKRRKFFLISEIKFVFSILCLTGSVFIGYRNRITIFFEIFSDDRTTDGARHLKELRGGKIFGKYFIELQM